MPDSLQGGSDCHVENIAAIFYGSYIFDILIVPEQLFEACCGGFYPGGSRSGHAGMALTRYPRK